MGGGALSAAQPSAQPQAIDPSRLWQNQTSLDLQNFPIFRASDIAYTDPRNVGQHWVGETEQNPGHYESDLGLGNQYAGWHVAGVGDHSGNIRNDTYDFIDPRGQINYTGESQVQLTPESESANATYRDPTTAESADLNARLNALSGAPEQFAFGIKSGGKHGLYEMYQKQGEYYVPTRSLGFQGGAGGALDTNESQRSMNTWLANTGLTAATYGLSDVAGAGVGAASATATTANTAADLARQALQAYQAGQGVYNSYNAFRRGDVLGGVAGGAGALGGLSGMGALGDVGRAIAPTARVVGGVAGLAGGIRNRNPFQAIGGGLSLSGATGLIDPNISGALGQVTGALGQGSRALRQPPQTLRLTRPTRPPPRPPVG